MYVKGWRETSNGKILEWGYAEKKINTKKKFSDEQVKTIRDLRNKYINISQKDFIKKIELDEGIKVGIATLKKIMDNVY